LHPGHSGGKPEWQKFLAGGEPDMSNAIAIKAAGTACAGI